MNIYGSAVPRKSIKYSTELFLLYLRDALSDISRGLERQVLEVNSVLLPKIQNAREVVDRVLVNL